MCYGSVTIKVYFSSYKQSKAGVPGWQGLDMVGAGRSSPTHCDSEAEDSFSCSSTVPQPCSFLHPTGRKGKIERRDKTPS